MHFISKSKSRIFVLISGDNTALYNVWGPFTNMV